MPIPNLAGYLPNLEMKFRILYLHNFDCLVKRYSNCGLRNALFVWYLSYDMYLKLTCYTIMAQPRDGSQQKRQRVTRKVIADDADDLSASDVSDDELNLRKLKL